MKNSSNQSDWSSQVYHRWVFLPVLAHLLSLLTGWFMLLLFPIFVTVAQYVILKKHPAVIRPGRWFITLPVTLFIWLWWGPFHYTSASQPYGILYGVGAYYGGQLLVALLISFLTEQPSSSTTFSSNSAGTDLTVQWLLATLLAAGIWVATYSLLIPFTGQLSGSQWRAGGVMTLLLTYPLISLIANGISGLIFR